MHIGVDLVTESDFVMYIGTNFGDKMIKKVNFQKMVPTLVPDTPNLDPSRYP